MNTQDIETRLFELTARTELFGHTIGGVTAMRWGHGWSIMVDHPKINVRSDTIEESFRLFEEALSRHEIAQSNLARTLGVDAAE